MKKDTDIEIIEQLFQTESTVLAGEAWLASIAVGKSVVSTLNA
jgi:hypothetical protein